MRTRRIKTWWWSFGRFEAAGRPLPSRRSWGRFQTTQPRRYRVKQDFDAVQKVEFGEAAFQTIADYFKRVRSEMHEASEHLRARFSDIAGMPSHAPWSISPWSREAKRTSRYVRAAASIMSVTFRGAGDSGGDDGSRNGWLSVEADDFELHLKGSVDRFGIGGGIR